MNIVNTDESILLEAQKYPAYIIIFEHIASQFNFNKSLEDVIYRVTDKRLEDWIEDDETYPDIVYDIFTEAMSHKKPIIIMEYNPDAADFLNYLFDNFKKEADILILGIMFFHNEEDTKKMTAEGMSDMTSDKKRFINQIKDCNNIKKLIIPLGYTIDENYIDRMVDELI